MDLPDHWVSFQCRNITFSGMKHYEADRSINCLTNQAVTGAETYHKSHRNKFAHRLQIWCIRFRLPTARFDLLMLPVLRATGHTTLVNDDVH